MAEHWSVDLDELLDCLVLGANPAGLPAALYLARFERRSLVVDAWDSCATWIPSDHSLDEQVTDERLRLAEICNFIEALTRFDRGGLLSVDRWDTAQSARNAARARPLPVAAVPCAGSAGIRATCVPNSDADAPRRYLPAPAARARHAHAEAFGRLVL